MRRDADLARVVMGFEVLLGLFGPRHDLSKSHRDFDLATADLLLTFLEMSLRADDAACLDRKHLKFM
jgi:hypothetical protein